MTRDTPRPASPDDGAFPAGASGLAYRPDLDGLRAVAVALVIVTHAKWPWPNFGGDTGVTAFFVLSGFLITTLLVGQRDRLGGIDILAFYRRRAIRLGPALLGVMAFVLVFGLVVGWGAGRHWQVGLVTSLVYASNWIQVADVNIDPLGHTWSLAIEEQFYLVWPALLLVLRSRVLTAAVVAIVVASLVRLVATGPLEYFSTVTRADAILVGCVLALIRPSWSATVAIAGLIALVGVSFLDLGHDVTILVAMIATAAVIGGRFETLGRLSPIGLRAYSLYLWNAPMTILFGSVFLVAPLLTVVIGELSYRLLEAPFMHRGRPIRPAGTRTTEGAHPVPVPVPGTLAPVATPDGGSGGS